MANHNATGKKAKRGPELAQRIRAAILTALDIMEQRGKSIAELLADEGMTNPLKILDIASKYIPKDLNVELNDNRDSAEQFTDDELADIAATSGNRAAKAKESTKQVH